MLKPCGTLSLSSGSLSAAVASGGATCGRSFDAASLSGWPISGEPGGSGVELALGLACCAAAPTVNAPRKTPASQRLRGDNVAVLWFSPSKGGGHSHAEQECRRGRPSARALSEFSSIVATKNIVIAPHEGARVLCGNRDGAQV